RLGLGCLADIDQGIGEIGIAPGIAGFERDGGLELLDGVVVPAALAGDVSGYLMRGRGGMDARLLEVCARLVEGRIRRHAEAAGPVLVVAAEIGHGERGMSARVG